MIPIPQGEKAPRLKNWPALRISHSDAEKYFAKPCNVGVLLGEPLQHDPSKILIDVDIDAIEAMEHADRLLPPTGCVFGRQEKPRSHRIYTVDAGDVQTKRFSTRQKRCIIEFRAGGAQTVIPPSIHPSGEPIEWAEAGEPAHVDAAALLEAVAAIADAVDPVIELPPITEPAAPGPEAYERCLRYLAHCPEAISGQGGHNATFRALCEVWRFGLSDHEADKAAQWWNDHKCQPRWSQKDLLHKLADSKKEVERTGEIGKRSKAVPPISYGLNRPAVVSNIPTIVDFPSDLLSPPGLLGDMCQWITSTAFKPQPVLALANSLAFLGTIFGGKVAGQDDTRTNVYTVGMSPSGSGKEHSRKCMSRLCAAAGIYTQVIGPEDVSSDTAILKILKDQPSLLLQFDEVGHMLASYNSQNAQSHMKSIPVCLTKLFSRANGVYSGKAFSSSEAIVVHNPNLCMYGTTVETRLFEAITRSEIEDGFAARVLFFSVPPSNWDPPEQDHSPQSPPDDIKKLVLSWWQRTDLERTEGNMTQKFKPMIVPESTDATIERKKFRQICRESKSRMRQKGLDSMWARAEEQASKLALICAAGCDYYKPMIAGEHMAWACRVVEHTIRMFEIQAMENIASTDAGKTKSRIYKVIKAAGTITHNNLVRSIQSIQGYKRKEALEDLIESGVIGFAAEKRKLDGPTVKTYCVLAELDVL